jgi:hypothetical protein
MQMLKAQQIRLEKKPKSTEAETDLSVDQRPKILKISILIQRRVIFYNIVMIIIHFSPLKI